MFNWAGFLTYMIVTAITPGPNNLMSLSNAGRLGFRKALPFNLGIWVGFSAASLICALFCDTLTALLPVMKLPMLIVGALYMLYLAVKTLKSTPELEDARSKGGFVHGLLVQFINPKLYLYCIISMEAYILPFYAGQTLPLVGFALLLAFVGFVCTLCWAAFGSAFKLVFSKYAKITNALMALLLVWCAISLFL